jgi:hypothetical protein
MIRDAAWLLRRYRDQACPDWRVKQVLDREFNRLVEDRYSLQSEVDELRRSAPERLRGFDSATDRALQRMAERRFDSALKEIRTAATELAELRRFVTVAADLRKSAEDLSGLADLLCPELLTLATPSALRRLLELSRRLLDQGEARKARFVALLIRQQLGLLRARETREPAASLTILLRDLSALGGEEAVAGIRELIRQRYFHLAERLAEDLEAELAVRDRVRRAAHTPGGSLGPLLHDLETVRARADAVKVSLARWLGEP